MGKSPGPAGSLIAVPRGWKEAVFIETQGRHLEWPQRELSHWRSRGWKAPDTHGGWKAPDTPLALPRAARRPALPGGPSLPPRGTRQASHYSQPLARSFFHLRQVNILHINRCFVLVLFAETSCTQKE